MKDALDMFLFTFFSGLGLGAAAIIIVPIVKWLNL